MSECDRYYMCKNNTKCYRCNNENLFVEMKSNRPKPIQKLKPTSKDKSWKHLEQDVANAISNVPDIATARRARASGALWFEKGDVIDSIIHFECKEREGYEVAKGKDKTFPMKKSWLDKAKEEALAVEKPMVLPFRFSGDEDIYAVIDMKDLADLIVHFKALKQELTKQEETMRLLKNKEG